MIERLRPAIRSNLEYLALHPIPLFAVIFAVNAVSVPYQGVIHDGKLYAAQALNAHDGRFADDMFFKFGSQAKYTLFPELFAKPCAAFGPKPTFFIGYVVATGILLASFQRLIVRLFGPTPEAVLGLLVLAAMPTPIGGLGIFQIHEPFFTPRPFAIALALFALERLLAGRLLQGFALLVPAAIIHPLMTAPALVFAALWVFSKYWRRFPAIAALLILTSLALAIALLTVPRLGNSVFGPMDADWREKILSLNRYADPANWHADDWLRLAWGTVLAVGMALTIWRSDADRARFALVSVVVAALGLGMAALAARSEYAILLQGQAYRWVIVLELLRAPLAVAAIGRLWQQGSPRSRLLAAGILLNFGALSITVPHVYPLLACCWAGAVIAVRGTGREPNRADWHGRSAVIAVVLATLLWQAFVVAILWSRHREQAWSMSLAFAERVDLASRMFGFWPKAFVLFGLLAASQKAFRLAAIPSLAIALAVHGLMFWVPQTEWAKREFDAYHADREFVRTYLAEHPSERRETIYWPCGNLETIWIDLERSCYFNTFQLSGNYFNRGNANEGHRRALMVRSFDIAEYKRMNNLYWEEELKYVPNVYDIGPDCPPPTRADFEKLVADPAVDVIVLTHEYPGASASNGRVFLYDARKLRK